MAKTKCRSTGTVLRMRRTIRSFGDLKKVLNFSQRELNLMGVLAGVADPRQAPQIPLGKILAGHVLALVGLGKNMLDIQDMFCSRRLLGMLGCRTKRLISDSRAMEINAMLGGLQLQKEALAPLVKQRLRLLENSEDYMKGIKHVAIDLTTASGFGIVDPVATGTHLSLPLGAVVPSYYVDDPHSEEGQTRKREFDKYRSPDALIKEYKKEAEMTNEEKKQADKACRGKGYELPASKLCIDHIIDTYGKGTFNMISADGKHLCYSEIKFAKDRGFDMLVRIRKDDKRNLLLIKELEDVIETSQKLKTTDERYGEGTGVDHERRIRWRLQTLYVEKEEIADLPCGVLVCKLIQESMDGKPLKGEERVKYLIVTNVNISYDAIYEVSKRHWSVEEQHKRLAEAMHMKHIWSHDPATVWTLFVLMLIAKVVASLYYEIVVVVVVGRDELSRQKIGLLVILRMLRKGWEARKTV